MTVTFTVSFVNSPDADDQLAARHAVFLENRRRSELVPPGTPLTFSTPAELKASYLTILAGTVTQFHLDTTAAAKSEAGVSQRFTLAQIAQMNANLVARLNTGSETSAQIVTDTAA